MGLALLVVIWLITFFSTYFFVAKTWWLPHGASTAAAFIDNQFALTYVLMGIVFVAAQGALGYLVWKYRGQRQQRPGRILPRQHHAGIDLDHADGGPFHWAEPDGEPRVGERAV